MEEIWKDIDGYENIYQISNYANVRRFYKNGKIKILKPSKNKDGYLCVSLSKDNIKKSYRINCLVAKAFVPNPNNLPEVDHIDTDKDNNIWTNLKWVTRIENMNNKLTKQKREEESEKYGRSGKDNYKSIKIAQLSLDGELIKIWESMREAERLGGFNNCCIGRCCKGACKSHKGFKWMFYEDYIERG